MKKIVCLILSIVLMMSFCITANAAGSASLSGKTSVTVGSNIEFTVNVSGCSDATSIAVSVSCGEGFELVSGTWLKRGSLSTFDKSNKKGALGGLSSPDVNGSVFKLVLKAKSASANAQSVRVNVIAKNGSTEIMNVSPSKSVSINCATHNYGAFAKVNDNNHSRTCSVCGNVETTTHSWNSGVQTKNPSCKETGIKTYTCSVCNGTKTETVAKTDKHSFGNWNQTNAPTCAGKGTEARTCSICQKTETRDIAATGHKMGAWSQTKEPTCSTKGEEKRICSVCKTEETREIKTIAHTMNAWATTKEATCTTEGKKESTCTVCGTKTEEIVVKTEHTFGEFVVTKEATETESGTKTATCATCGEVKEEIIPVIVPEVTPEPTPEPTPEVTPTIEPEVTATPETTPDVVDNNDSEDFNPLLVIIPIVVVGLGVGAALVIKKKKQ